MKRPLVRILGAAVGVAVVLSACNPFAAEPTVPATGRHWEFIEAQISGSTAVIVIEAVSPVELDVRMDSNIEPGRADNAGRAGTRRYHFNDLAPGDHSLSINDAAGNSSSRRITVPAPGSRPVLLHHEFTVIPGEQVTLEGANMALRFAGVTADSRCQAETECVTAGEAEIALVASPFGGAETSLTLIVPPGGEGAARTDDLEVRAVALEPDPPPVGGPADGDYQLTLIVERR